VNRLRDALLTILFVLPPLLGGAIPDSIGYFQSSAWPQFTVTVAGVILPVFLGIYFLLRPPEPQVVLKSPRLVRDRSDTRPGLVILVSTLDPQTGNTGNLPSRRDDRMGVIEQAIYTAISNANPRMIDLEHSNLIQPLRAVRAHANNRGHLSHIWLVSTKKSSPSAHLLALYIEKEFPSLVIMHAKRPNYDWLEIAAEDSSETEALERTIRVTKQVFDDAKRLRLKPKDIVCDVTGGFKSMTVGMTLASLHNARDLQYVPQQGEQPVITDFEIRNDR
jgi:hypothetical protein